MIGIRSIQQEILWILNHIHH